MFKVGDKVRVRPLQAVLSELGTVSADYDSYLRNKHETLITVMKGNAGTVTRVVPDFWRYEFNSSGIKISADVGIPPTIFFESAINKTRRT